MEGEQPTLYIKTDDTGEYHEYTPPEPKPFAETLPEDLRESEHLKEIKGADELARYYVDLKSNWIKPPDTADGYEFEKPDGYELDEESFKAIKQTAFENGVNQKQFDALMKFDADRSIKMLESVKSAIESHRTEAEASLKKDWGDNFEKNLEAAKSVLNHEKLADPQFKKFLEDTRFGDNPEVIKFFHKIASAISEDSFIKPGKGGDIPGQKRTEDGRPMLNFPSMEKKSA
jgi:hypothetical protein